MSENKNKIVNHPLPEFLLPPAGRGRGRRTELRRRQHQSPESHENAPAGSDVCLSYLTECFHHVRVNNEIDDSIRAVELTEQKQDKACSPGVHGGNKSVLNKTNIYGMVRSLILSFLILILRSVKNKFNILFPMSSLINLNKNSCYQLFNTFCRRFCFEKNIQERRQE